MGRPCTFSLFTSSFPVISSGRLPEGLDRGIRLISYQNRGAAMRVSSAMDIFPIRRGAVRRCQSWRSIPLPLDFGF